MNYSKEHYKVYTWRNWMMLHWILNPGLVINELILGQRIPEVSLVDKTSDKPRFERTYIPCPHCHKLHDGRTWSAENNTAFSNWFGLYCQNCGKIIPCLINVFSLAILVITFPIWGWFRKPLKARWLENQPKRYRNNKIETSQNNYSKRNWIKTGLSWGAIMFVLTAIIFPLLSSQEISWKSIIVGIPLWIAGGLAFGYSMKLFTEQKIKNKTAIKD